MIRSVLLVLSVLALAGCRATAAGDALPLAWAPTPTLMRLAPDAPVACPPPAFERTPSAIHLPGTDWRALFAVTQHAQTTIFAFHERGATSLTGPRTLGKVQLSADGRVLAYEALEGINPLHNVAEVADLATGTVWRVTPGQGCAALGFTLDAAGERLALLQVAMRGRFKPAAWQVSVVDFASGNVSALGPAQPQEMALEPVAWSAATDEIVLRAFVPFQADGAAGLWAVRADGSRLRPLLSEADYVGRPRLSPDGRRLAFFVSEPDDLPKEYVASPGEPPANGLHILNLLNGETRLLTRTAERIFDALAWDAAGGHLYFSRGVWHGAGDVFQIDEIVSLSLNPSTPEVVIRVPERVLSLQPCAGGNLAYVTQRGQEAVVHWETPGGLTGDTEWAIQGGAVEILACLHDE